MPTLPWQAVRSPAGTAPVVTVMASRFRLRRLRDVPRFMLDSMRIHRQVLAADGAVGVALVAHPLRREFLTLSAWVDRAALSSMVRNEPHRSVMQQQRSAMLESAFTFWEESAAALPIGWDEARSRLDRDRVAHDG